MANKTYTTMSEESIRYLCGLINKIVSLPTDIISNINLADNLTFSNIHIKNLIDQCLQDAKDHSEAIVNSLTHLVAEKIDFEPTLDNTTNKINTLLLYSKNNDNNYTQYLRLANELLNLGDTSLSLNDYLKITEAASTYTKLTDFKTLSDEVSGIKTKIGSDSLVTTSDTLVGAINEVANKSTIVSLTKAEYDALATKDPETYYIITDDEQSVTVTPSINASSTDGEVPTAKAVNTKVDSITIKKITYGSPCVIEDVLETYTPDVDVVFAGTTSGELVNLTGIQLFCIEYRQVGNLYLQRAYSAINGSLVACRSKNWWDATWSKWQRVVTTKVADVVNSVTNVSTLGIAEITDGLIVVSVKNGWCQVVIQGLIVSSTFSNNIDIPVNNLPKPAYQYNWEAIFDYNSSHTSNGTSTNIMFVRPNVGGGTLMVDYATAKAGNYFTTFSYPVAES